MTKLVELDKVDKMLWSRLYKDMNAYNNCKNGLDKIPIIDEDKIRADAIDECIKFIKNHSTRAFIDSDGWGCSDYDREEIFKLFWLDNIGTVKGADKIINLFHSIKLNYLIFKCERSHKRWMKAENELKKLKEKNDE